METSELVGQMNMTPEHIKAFEGLGAVGVLGVIMFGLVLVVVPVVCVLTFRAFVKLTQSFRESLQLHEKTVTRILRSQRKIVAALHAMSKRIERIEQYATKDETEHTAEQTDKPPPEK